MPGPFDFLHIKGRTAGSSNELSFDVLDAARRDADANARKKQPRAAIAPKPSQGTYHGVAGTSTLSAVPEVERRKKVRRARSIRVGAIAFVAIVALAALGVYAGVRFYQSQVDYSSRFGALIDRIVAVDQSLTAVDGLMSDPLSTVGADKRKEMSARVAELEEELSAISDEAARMSQENRPDQDNTALAQVQAATTARQGMLEAADDAFALALVVNKQANDANTAWSKVLAGDEAAREAAELANSASTEEATVQARTKTEEAIASLATARDELAAIEKERKGVDFSPERAYLDKRIESLDAAVGTADALLANDRAAATAANDAYNAADAEAAELAAALDQYAGDKVKAAYADDLDQIQRRYADARAETTTTDSAIRAYLA